MLVSRRLDTTCVSLSPSRHHLDRALILLFVTGTRICGVQTLVSSDLSVGSKRVGKLNHPSGCMVTCMPSVKFRRNCGPLTCRLSSVTFSGGTRSCLGWRVACVDHLSHYPLPRNTESRLLGSVIEMQAFLVTLVRKFDISNADHHPQIKRTKSGLMAPVVLGEEHKGTQLPLKITAVRNA